MTKQPGGGGNGWWRKPGIVAALATIVAASAIAVVAGRSDGGDKTTSAAAVRQVVVPPPATPPPTETTIAAPPPEPVSSSTSTTAVTVPPAPPSTAAAAESQPPATREPAPPPVPVTLTAALQQAMAGVNGCLIVEDDTGALKTLFDLNSGTAFVPASSQKVLVAAAVISRLGSDFRFETRVVAPAPAQDGVLHDAWLVGGGDPLLVTPDYAAWLTTKPRTADTAVTPLTVLADELVAMGVRSIPAGLRTDESRYPPQRSVPTWKPSYVTEAEVGSLGALTVNEGLASWGANQKVAPDPAISAANALGRLLTDRGVSLPGPTAGGTAPSDAVVIASVRSAPLGEIVAAMLRSSDNYVAEMLVKELDRHFGGPGLTAGGTARVVQELGRLGVPVDGVHLNDGSGLDTGNRATCRALLGALDLSRKPRFSVLDSGLAIAGRTGTLAKRYVGSPAEIRLAAKTGWINGCAAMVGRIARDPTRRFALIFNGQFGWPHAQAVQDRVVAALTSNLPF
ncbi:MAG: D-alanyl-D-alanine carboxypeptidase [Actinomycetota bacterium]|jgi:serine-type D-Ala-D-Ala carboxypeptidase/endopeptidase (penicillin-binding protein 4)